MSARHTKGPWVAVSHENGIPAAFAIHSWAWASPDKLDSKAFISGHVDGLNYLDDLRLIASAPDLLEALENLANAARATPRFASPMLLAEADKAIARAKATSDA